MLNTVAAQYGLVLVTVGDCDNVQLAASLQSELMALGFVFDQRAFDAACKAPDDWLRRYYAEVIPELRDRVSASRNYDPFYKNFPSQVMAMSDAQLFCNAFFHYVTDGKWEPPQALCDRGFAFENSKFKELRLTTEEELKGIFTRVVSMNQSLTGRDRHALGWFIDTYGGTNLTLPNEIPFKETLCILAAKGLDVPVKTPTDVLRIAVYLSGGDISLPGVPKPYTPQIATGSQSMHLKYFAAARQRERQKFRFRKFNRPERRRILSLLEQTKPEASQMQGHLGRWLRLGEILHVGEFADRFPRCAEAFQILRNQQKGRKVRTFAAEVDLAFRDDWKRGVDLLAKRPGMFARRLDWMLRQFDPAWVLQKFDHVGRQLSSKLLFELYSHFRQRHKADSPRAVLIKGARSKLKLLPSLPPLDGDLVQGIGNAILRLMRSRMAPLPPLGKVWIDPQLKDIPVPSSMRGVNTAIRTYIRGSRIPFGSNAKVIRAFIHWFDEEGNQDIDLSAGLYSESLNSLSLISFSRLKDDKLNCCHSGDVRHRRGPCAEYVDVDIQQARRHGVRYVTIHVYNYNARPMHTVKDCVFGLMEREHPESNPMFVPKTISNCLAVGNEGTAVAVCVLDLKDASYIWADVESDAVLPTIENMVARNADMLASILNGTKMSVYELLELHADVRGEKVSDAASADQCFGWDEFATNYVKTGEFMSF